MIKGIKLAAIVLLFAAILIAFFLFFGFYAMEIEDHFGNHQEIFYRSRNGDVIVQENSKDFGVVQKSWTRLTLWTNEKDSLGLYHFIGDSQEMESVKIYRSRDSAIDFKEKSYKEIQAMIQHEIIYLVDIK